VTTTHASNALESFQWSPQPQAQALIARLSDRFLSHSAFARKLKGRLYAEAAVRFVDLIDSIHVPSSFLAGDELAEAGFVRKAVAGAQVHYVQEQGIFPAVVLHEIAPMQVYLKVESVADFLAAWQNLAAIEGAPLAAMRKACVAHGRETELWAIERHGYRGFDVPQIGAHDTAAVLSHAESFRRRRRSFHSVSSGFTHTSQFIDAAIADLGLNRACDLFFAAEREYWQRRNRAAQIQKARQDALGIGWANHDHHTYRSSRKHFVRMIARFEQLGFHCRERFYAGGQAGWGAQVLEQPEAGLVIFADVDLSPDELFEDFAHDGLAPRDQLGTVGLWCALHGEAFLEAGMHHLECQFDFQALKQQLESGPGIKVMKPFTDFPYLRQAFTEGETWPVRPARIQKLLQAGQITNEQAERFRVHGAIGSHLENLERNDGFKGFNQTGVSEIIARTDPRAQAAQHE
jgi:hypothetical protein